MSLETFDPIAYFEDRDIAYSTEGKNVTENWVNIECPFPFCDDSVLHSNHLGINLESKLFSCWICGEKGGMDRLIQELEGCSWSESQVILSQFQENPYKDIPLDTKYPETDLKSPEIPAKNIPQVPESVCPFHPSLHKSNRKIILIQDLFQDD